MSTIAKSVAAVRRGAKGAGLAGVALAGCILVAGCASDPTKGYCFTSSYDTSIRTVAVPMFQNPTYARGLEIELTDAIVKEIQSRTPWRVTTEGTANTTLSGTLTNSQLQQLSVSRDTGYVQELGVTLTVDFDWKDARTGKTLISRRNFSAEASFVPESPANERIEHGQHAAIQKLARDIVTELRSNW